MPSWLKRIWKRFRYVIRLLDDAPYLVRYRLLKTPWFGVYVHHILRSDNDRELHDHPWNFWSLVLWGSYVEYRPVDALPPGDWLTDPDGHVRLPRPWLSLARRKATDLHRVWLPNGKTVWTLFISGPKYREWGFLTPTGWVHTKTYHARKGIYVEA